MSVNSLIVLIMITKLVANISAYFLILTGGVQKHGSIFQDTGCTSPLKASSLTYWCGMGGGRGGLRSILVHNNNKHTWCNLRLFAGSTIGCVIVDTQSTINSYVGCNNWSAVTVINNSLLIGHTFTLPFAILLPRIT